MGDDEDVVAQCASLQEDEIAVLESIYPGLITCSDFQSSSTGRQLKLQLQIEISLPTPVATRLRLSAFQPSTSAPPPIFQLSHLPPIQVDLSLSSSYPLKSPVQFANISAPLPNEAQTSWLSPSIFNKIANKLSAFWQEEFDLAGEGSGLIWKWWEWVGNGDFLHELGLIRDDRLNLTVPPGIAASTFHTILKTYNASQLHSSFEATAFSCSICLENRKGKSCIRMPCDCVFCTPCLQSCWTLAITEGTLENVSCPSVSCVKRRATRIPNDPNGTNSAEEMQDVDPHLVEDVVGKELRQRWETLKERRIAEIDPTYTVCPQPKCQAAVPPPKAPSTEDLAAQAAISSRVIRLPSSRPIESPSSDHPHVIATEDRWARYRQCPKCSFSFCLYCNSTWHGPHTACNFPQTSAIVLEYLSYPEQGPERRRMEMQRGKANLERMVTQYHEDEENKKWLESRTRQCSGCGVRVEKSHGCNHMTCGRCAAHFCHRCGQSLKPNDPYAHYNRPGTSCFEKLFDQEEIARFERETALGVGAGMVDPLAEWREAGPWDWWR